MQQGGDPSGWAEWPLVSGGWQAWDEELPEISEQPVLAGTLSVASYSTIQGHANHSFL